MAEGIGEAAAEGLITGSGQGLTDDSYQENKDEKGGGPRDKDGVWKDENSQKKFSDQAREEKEFLPAALDRSPAEDPDRRRSADEVPSDSPSATRAPKGDGSSARKSMGAEGRPSRTLKKAQAMGESLRGGMNLGDLGASLESGAEPGAGRLRGKAAAGSIMPAPVSAPATARPRASDAASANKNLLDQALLFSPGYAPAIESLGLKTVKDSDGGMTVVKEDGSPATEEDLSRLGERLRSEPAALLKRPDFFKVVQRSDYDDLKKRWARLSSSYSEDTRHMGLDDEERDFTWESSCSGVDGDCNPHVGGRSYRKNDFIFPETLREVIARIKSPAKGPSASADGAPPKNAGLHAKLRGFGLIILGLSKHEEDVIRGVRTSSFPVSGGETDLFHGAGPDGSQERGLTSIDPGLPENDGVKEGGGSGAGLSWGKILLAAVGAGLFFLGAWFVGWRRE